MLQCLWFCICRGRHFVTTFRHWHWAAQPAEPTLDKPFGWSEYKFDLHTRTHTHPFYSPMDFVWDYPGETVPEPIWIILKQETLSGCGISSAVCKSAPSSRQITMPVAHPSNFYRLDALPATQPTVSKHNQVIRAQQLPRQSTLNPPDKDSMTVTNSKGPNAEPRCTLTLTQNCHHHHKPFLQLFLHQYTQTWLPIPTMPHCPTPNLCTAHPITLPEPHQKPFPNPQSQIRASHLPIPAAFILQQKRHRWLGEPVPVPEK